MPSCASCTVSAQVFCTFFAACVSEVSGAYVFYIMLFAFGFVVSFFVVAMARCSCSILIFGTNKCASKPQALSPTECKLWVQRDFRRETTGLTSCSCPVVLASLNASWFCVVNIWSTWMNIKLQYNPRTFHLCTPIRRLTRRYECLYWTFSLTGVHCWQPLAQSTAEGLGGRGFKFGSLAWLHLKLQQTWPVFKGQMVLAIATAQIFRRSCTHIPSI